MFLVAAFGVVVFVVLLCFVVWACLGVPGVPAVSLVFLMLVCCVRSLFCCRVGAVEEFGGCYYRCSAFGVFRLCWGCRYRGSVVSVRCCGAMFGVGAVLQRSKHCSVCLHVLCCFLLPYPLLCVHVLLRWLLPLLACRYRGCYVFDVLCVFAVVVLLLVCCLRSLCCRVGVSCSFATF